MTTKHNHAKRTHQYGIPLPLPALQKQSQALPPVTTPRFTVPVDTTRSVWVLSLSPIIATLRSLYRLCDNKVLPSRGLIQGHFHSNGASVWIIGSKDIETLFQQGFFGKGTLSRSEATWKARTAGSLQGVSLEDITRQRRAERTLMRMEKLAQTQQGNPAGSAPLASPEIVLEVPSLAPLVSTALTVPLGEQLLNPQPCNIITQLATSSTLPDTSVNETSQDKAIGNNPENYEHLQLSLEEAFFLVFAVECIAVSIQTTTACSHLKRLPDLTPLSVQECWLQFAEASALQKSVCSPISPCFSEDSTDNPFLIRYAAYHYYRSLGWVVKDGLKYGTDYLLYKKGVIYEHSQFGVRVIACKTATEIAPSTVHLQAMGLSLPTSPTSLLSSTPGHFISHAVHSWQWLLSLNRVISQVQKVDNLSL